jgi:hypothetical protein
MDDMLNNGGHANGNVIGTEECTQAEAYDIDAQPFFDMATADCMAFFVDGQGEDESEDDNDDADPDGDVPEDAMATTTNDDPAAKKKKKISKRTAGYTAKEDVCFCRSWLAISQDAISGAEQKGKAYWKKGHRRLPRAAAAQALQDPWRPWPSVHSKAVVPPS